MASDTNEDDPWFWSIDRVVQELCTEKRTWIPRVTSRPDPALLERTLREQEIEGSVLLVDVTDECIRQDLGMKSLGGRVFVRDCIDKLKRRSDRYQTYVLEDKYRDPEPDPTLGSCQALFNEFFKRLHPSEPAAGEKRTSEDYVLTEEGQKRRKLDLPLTLDKDYEPANTFTHEAGVSQGENGILTQAPGLPSGLDANGKKRKRIAPTLITSVVDVHRDRGLPTEADNISQYHPDTDEPEESNIFEMSQNLPVEYPDGQRSDIESQVHSHQQSSTPLITQRKAVPSKESAAAGYLGKKKMQVDDLFYKDTPVGKELPDFDENLALSLVRQDISNGRRRYVHGVMKNFLRSKPQTIIQDGKPCSAVYPYPAKLVPKFQKPSFTLYYPTSEGVIHARRMEYNPDEPLSTGDEHTATFNPLGPGMIEGLGTADEWDESCLEKYKQLQDGDTILPLYGESDEENEYDLATWKEIEEELGGKLDRPERKTRNLPISLVETNEAIDEGIADLVLKWKTKVLPKRELRAWSIWRKSRVRQDKREQISRAQKDLEERLRRIAKMRKEIASDVWTSKEHVRKQIQIMEIDVFTREDLLWKISILELKACPEKQLAPTSPSKVAPAKSDNDEEGESIQTATESISSDDGLDDFVIPDEVVDSVEVERHELDLADSELDIDVDDGVMSDAPEDVPAMPKRKIAIKSKEKATSSTENTPMRENSDFSEVDASTPLIKGEEPTLPKLLIPASSPPEMIDLTMMSSDDSKAQSPNGSSDSPIVINLITPTKTKFGIIHSRSPLNSPVVISDADELVLDENELPPKGDPTLIALHLYETWENLKDRERLLIKVVHSLSHEHQIEIFNVFSTLDEEDLWKNGMKCVTSALLAGEENQRGIDQHLFDTLVRITKLWHIFTTCKHLPMRKRLKSEQLQTLLDNWEQNFPVFYQFCSKLEDYFAQRSVSTEPSSPSPIPKKTAKGKKVNGAPGDDDDEDDEDARPPLKRRSQEITASASDEDVPTQSSVHKKRKKKIFENAQARKLREQDKERLQVQQERRNALLASLALTGHSQDDDDRNAIIVNDAATDDQEIIYVHPHIANRIKKHQIEGLRFMWNQIVAGRDEESMQGCLLAHTMGLGKTMQTICLLVSIAQAATSTNPRIYSQVPSCLRVSKTLVLCPPTIINNWMDELWTWVPGDILGEMKKVDDSLALPLRLETISDWSQKGGVLLLSYDMFRGFINNKAIKGKTRLTEEEHEEVRKNLLDKPNIIIADEAHKMKNAGSLITLAASQFRSKSRIALTGSPLANNIEEYHTMIQWVAPNYLGPIVEFRAKYVEPIQAGLYADSTSYDKRKALKMLGVLKEDIGPKVHRADMSVLRNDLPPKKEFVITVPLTDIQRKAYSLYVRSVISGKVSRTKTGLVTQTTIWHWLAVLSLLCNHPDCFNSKLLERSKDAGQKPAGSSPDPAEEIVNELNDAIWKVGVSQELVDDITKLFLEEVDDMKSIELSYKVKILCQILDASAAVGDKVLVFSQSIPTLEFLEKMCKKQHRKYSRLDGKTNIQKRQQSTKDFNEGSQELYLISTTAGGLGLNLFSANRVVIFDFKFNPTMEEQAVGRSYRIGQKKPTFVYRFVVGGTYETGVHNKTIFKQQLFSRVVDKKNPVSYATKKLSDFLFEPKDIEQQDLKDFKGVDLVLDKILASQVEGAQTIRQIVQTDTFERDDVDGKLTADEEKEVQQLISDEQLKRSDPQKWQEVMAKRIREAHHQAQQAQQARPPQPYGPCRPQATGNGVPPISPAAQSNYASGGSFAQNNNPGNATQATEPPVILPPPRPQSNLSTENSSATGTTGNASEISRIPAAITKVRSHTPEPQSSSRTPSLQDNMTAQFAHNNLSTAQGEAPTRTPTNYADKPPREKLLRRKLRGAAQELGTSPDESKKIATRILEDTLPLIRKRSSSNENYHETLALVLSSLQADDSKLKLLVQSKLSPDDFVKSIIPAGTEPSSSSSSNPDDIKNTDLYKAVTRRSYRVKSLREPVTKTLTSLHGVEDAQELQKIRENRRVRGMPSIDSLRPLPDWAQKNVKDAQSSNRRQHVHTSTVTPSSSSSLQVVVPNFTEGVRKRREHAQRRTEDTH